VLGYLSPDYFLGGRATLDREAALDAVGKLGEQLGLDVMETAAGINRIVDFNMADLIRKETIQRGYDPRDFVVFTYGGAGPTHAGVYARELGVSKVVVPLSNTASVWSALGVASSDVIHVHQRDDILPAPFDVDRLRETRDGLRTRALDELHGEGFDDDHISLRWTADLRHRLQVHVVEVSFPDHDFGDAHLADLVERFEESYETLYGKGTAYTAAGVELVTLRCTASARAQKPTLGQTEEAGPTPPGAAVVTPREIYWPEWGRLHETPIYRGEHLTAGNVIEGPAVIEPAVTTIVIRPGQTATVDGFGNIVVALDQEKGN
jgi:N-methylhydantoinase A